jgi:hypothetical protein
MASATDRGDRPRIRGLTRDASEIAMVDEQEEEDEFWTVKWVCRLVGRASIMNESEPK